MTGILASIQNLLISIFDVIVGIFNTIFSSVQGVFAVVGTMLHSAVQMAQGLVTFLLNNIVIIGVLLAVVVGYSAYQQKQGRTVTSKKTI